MSTGEGIFSTSEAAYAVDRDGQIVVWNRAAERTFGYKKTEALGRNCWELLSGRDMFGNRSCCKGCPVREAAFKEERVHLFKVDFKTAAQRRKSFLVTTLMLFGVSGKDLFVHICNPESDLALNTTISPVNGKPRHNLTPRETEVLSLLHQGKTIGDIAARLTVSTTTVRNHTQHILYKLNVHSRFEAVALGRKLGLI